MPNHMPNINCAAELVAGNKTYRLSTSIKGVAALERQTGKSFYGFLESGSSQFGFTELHVLAWALMQRDHPEVDMDKAADIIDEAGLGAAMAAVVKALEAIAGDVGAFAPNRKARRALAKAA